MEKAKIEKLNINVMIKWTCPKCNHSNTIEYSGSPYRALADDEFDDDCEKCKDFFILDFYE